jgi:hypothetical protein
MNLTNPTGLSTIFINTPSAPQAAPSIARIDAAQLTLLVQNAARSLGLQTTTIEPIFSRMPPPPDEPHVFRVRTTDGRMGVVRTPGDMPVTVVQGLISADLKKEFHIGDTH